MKTVPRAVARRMVGHGQTKKTVSISVCGEIGVNNHSSVVDEALCSVLVQFNSCCCVCTL